MAGFPRFGTILSRVFELEGSPGQIVDGISPTLELESELQHPERLWSSTQRLMVGVGTDAAVAAQYSAVGLMNRADAGLLYVVDHIDITVGASMRVGLGFGDITAFDAATGALYRDSRWGNSSIASRMVTRTNVTPPTSSTAVVACTLGSTVFLDRKWVLHPATILWVVGETVNQALTVTFYWRERAALENELIGTAPTP